MKIFATALCFFVGSTIASVLAKEPDSTKENSLSGESLTTRVDKLFAEWDKSDSPGCSLAISRNGTVVYERGYGIANLELGVHITPGTVFPAASISKQFTAMSVLLLAQRGKLSLDDEVKKFIPEWAYTEHAITIRHLLTHTSGLRDAFTLLGIAASRENGTNVNEAIAAVLARQRGVNFTPGTEFQYNNGGYNLLGTIVKRVSGQSLRAFADANIFKPLGMIHTHFHDDPAMLVPDRASGYSVGKNGFRLARPEGGVVGNAGLYTTARDLLQWEQNFADARVGGRTLIAEMQEPATATDWGDGSFYGFGLAIGEYRGLRMVGHGGGDPGISAYVARFPDQGLAVAVLGNLDSINTSMLVRSVADIYLANSFPAPSATNSASVPAKVSLSPEQLASKAGLYRDPTTEIVGLFFIRDGKLMASADTGEENSVELVPSHANRFVIPGTTIAVEFIPGPGGQAQEVRVTGVGPKAKVSQRLQPFTTSSKDLRAFAGEYTSEEIETTYAITSRDSDLLARMPAGDEILRPVSSDTFAGSTLAIVRFFRDADGIVTRFTVNTSGVRGLPFERVKK
jgi:CubicO group peptidase (beta-lactamase class C family)